MTSLPRPLRVVGLCFAFLLPLACGGSPEAQDPNDDGAVCQTLYGDACGRACDEDTPCDDGMFCRDGACHAECDATTPCKDGGTCSADGECKGGGSLPPPTPECEPQTCAEVGFACGIMVDECGNVVDCADEGLTCAADEVCLGNPTECVTGNFFQDCDVCSHIPDCSDEDQVTVLRGRVVSPGQEDDDTANQVGIPNAVVYILRTADFNDLPAISSGVPSDGMSCDRCEDQDYGPVLVGAVTDATGHFELTEYIPVDTDFLLVVKAGKFRRAINFKVSKDAACKTTDLSEVPIAENPTRLPRTMNDGLAVNIPHVAVVTGAIDAMECVFYKMGLQEDQFSTPDGDGPIHLYRANGAWPAEVDSSCAACAACGTGGGGTAQTCRANNCNNGNSCNSTCRNNYLAACQADFDGALLYQDDGAIHDYDLVVLDCEGSGWDSGFNERNAYGHNIRDYVNRGGRMFASHLSFSWLHGNGDQAYDPDDPIATGLADAATWRTSAVSNRNSGTGIISQNRDNTSPRIENFIEWMVSEGVATLNANDEHTFTIIEPRSQANALGEFSEEFVHCDGGDCSGEYVRTQQFSFNTPYGAPEEAACGRVSYSGFHVSIGNTDDRVFPSHCGGDLTDQEKVLLYMLFDLGACVGKDPPAPPCKAATCPEDACGFIPDGCGGVVDCGTCTPKPIK